MSRLATESLVKEFSGRRVVDGVSLELRKGEIVGLLGANGAGKSTTFNMIVGFLRPTSGRILLNDQDITGLPMHHRARLGIGYLAQDMSIFRKLTVEENILAILETTKLPKEKQRERLEMLLEELGIAHLAKSRAYTLSGGERRRVEIARALVHEPDFILLDEPFSGVDPKAVEELQDIIFHMQARGLGVLITDHNVRETLSVTDRSYIIFEGRVMLSGTAEELVNSPEARKYYLGERFYMDVSRIEQRKRELTHKTSLPPLKANGAEGEPKR
ncbi:MAG: LPS export ABC transporter ATP-binding protein [Candidatus Sumerlaea chitinivorans]|nr:LPS export ABC transporter ATP-binding protein [Candidatus Sumerlaea chitinivorans]